MDWEFRGHCHRFGDDVPLDDGLIPFKLAMARITEPKELIPHLFESIAPGFADRAAAGDIIVAGKRFGCGKPHAQGFIALQARGIGVVCESMPFNSYRAAISRGLVFMPQCPGVTQLADDDDELEVNFASGQFRNVTRGLKENFQPLDPELRRIVEQGGLRGMLRGWWDSQNAS